ncbi:DUF4389 domain-containing protein [Candidatus Woesearchaeota archaeon]|nr:DUF4389 domain-containing protein [Candidatus Woesearchaeota archaeon]MBI2661463.1 DUF4389 domain-containing protein [Candidatus Woesearchaeota archaeon]
MSEKKEAWMRIVVGIVSGIIFSIWKTLVMVLSVMNFIYAIFANKRSKTMAEFCNLWATQAYNFIRYMTFATNTRPFPFSELAKVMHAVEMKSRK